MRRQNSESISSLLKSFVEENHLEDGLQRVRIFEAWDTALCSLVAPSMGDEAALRLTSRKFFRDGVLTCTISSSTVRSQLRFHLEPLRDRVNSLLGGEVVTRIILN
ncbi:MAG: DUF721 domain-containing protein [Bacteroidales bacterium]|nr:DUF721 domain-containing protein [Bacteroidales bacterium]